MAVFHGLLLENVHPSVPVKIVVADTEQIFKGQRTLAVYLTGQGWNAKKQEIRYWNVFQPLDE